jgi:DNA-binding transcriptional regulator YiaG
LLDANPAHPYRLPMNEPLTPDEIVATAETHGMTPQQLCERAGVAYTVLWRWRTGRGDIKLTSYRALVSAARGAP